jgi:D-alanine-D-alanine ligase
MGYGRLDIRMDKQSNKLCVLEVNAQCGLSEDENYTSIGAILRFARKSFTYLIIEIIEDALMRRIMGQNIKQNK